MNPESESINDEQADKKLNRQPSAASSQRIYLASKDANKILSGLPFYEIEDH
jgi:hypothetical protein